MRVVFCGDTFPAARALLQTRLPGVELCVAKDINSLLSVKADVLVPMMFRIDGQLMDRLRPRLIQQWGSGLENVDLDAARVRSIPVASLPAVGSNAESVAEHALLLILSLLRDFRRAEANIRNGILGDPMGRMLSGRSVCLWGLGATALALAHRLRALDAKLLGITRDPYADKVAGFRLDACYANQDRAVCLRATEVLVLCVRLCSDTRGMVDDRTLAMLPEGAYLVNTSRGALVNYDALYGALSRGKLAGAGLDVFWEEPIPPDDPLLGLSNVIATPHIAGVTDASYGEIADAVAANIERLQAGEPILNRAI